MTKLEIDPEWIRKAKEIELKANQGKRKPHERYRPSSDVITHASERAVEIALNAKRMSETPGINGFHFN